MHTNASAHHAAMQPKYNLRWVLSVLLNAKLAASRASAHNYVRLVSTNTLCIKGYMCDDIWD